MPVDVTTETVIRQPIGVVASYAADPSNAPVWYANIDTVEWEGAPVVRQGARVAFVARFLGRRLAYTYQLVDLEPGVRLVMRTADGPFPMETTYHWTAIDATSTRMSLRNRGEPAGFSKLASPFLTTAMKRANRKDLAKLRTILET